MEEKTEVPEIQTKIIEEIRKLYDSIRDNRFATYLYESYNFIDDYVHSKNIKLNKSFDDEKSINQLVKNRTEFQKINNTLILLCRTIQFKQGISLQFNTYLLLFSYMNHRYKNANYLVNKLILELKLTFDLENVYVDLIKRIKEVNNGSINVTGNKVINKQIINIILDFHEKNNDIKFEDNRNHIILLYDTYTGINELV
jgi:hypothetical protein